MASITAANRTATTTLTAAAADSVQLTGYTGFVEVTNVSGVDVLSFRVDGTAAVAGAKENYAIPAGVGASLIVPCPNTGGSNTGGTFVSIISPSAVIYQVSVVPQ